MIVKEILAGEIDDFLKLNRKDLAKITSVLVSAANKRVGRFLKQGLPISSKYYGGNKFSVKGKDKVDLKKEFIRVYRFMKTKTTTLREYKKRNKTLTNLIGSDNIIKDEFFNTYKELYHEGRIFEKFKYLTWESIREETEIGLEIDIEEIAKRTLEKLVNQESISIKQYRDLLDEMKLSDVKPFTYYE